MRQTWGLLQAAVWALSAAVVALCLFRPAVGLHALWNVLIPVAPALFVLAPGVWRNVCPLGSTSQIPRRLGVSTHWNAPPAWQGRMAAIGVVLLLAIVPLRRVVLDTNGPATAATLVAIGAAALAAGLLFEGKSGWCAGLCPVRPVESLYGQRPATDVANAHCRTCAACVATCPDSAQAGRALSRHPAVILFVGGFAGFIWGWFQVPDSTGPVGWREVAMAYAYPAAGLAVTAALFLGLRATLHERHGPVLIRGFAAAAVSCYYWYRIPALVGMGPFPGDGTLVDLSGTLPAWFPILARSVTTPFFFGWMLWPRASAPRWTVPPASARVPLRDASGASQAALG